MGWGVPPGQWDRRWRGANRRRTGPGPGRGGILPAALEAVALAVHLDDVDVVGEPVQQRAGEPFGSKHVGPLVEGQIGGDEDGAAFVALAEDLEEEFRAGGGQGDEAQLVDDEQLVARQLPAAD